MRENISPRVSTAPVMPTKIDKQEIFVNKILIETPANVSVEPSSSAGKWPAKYNMMKLATFPRLKVKAKGMALW
jgi:hypothetical protein